MLDFGGIELVNSSSEVWQNSPATNSAARYSAWLIDLIIRQVLEIVSTGLPESASDISTEFPELATLPETDQAIQQKLIEIEKVKLEIEGKQSHLKLLRYQLKTFKLAKHVRQLSLTNQRLEQWRSRREGHSSSRSFPPKLLNVVVKGISVFVLAYLVGMVLGNNAPEKIACDKEFSLCYFLRFNKNEVVTPRTCEQNPKEPLCAFF